MFTPSRQRGVEILDDPSTNPTLAIRSLRDVRLANRLFGGQRAILGALRNVLANGAGYRIGTDISLVDVGAGLGDIPAAATTMARALNVTLHTIGVERVHALTRSARPQCHDAVTGDALALPFANNSVDIITCSQVLHHFDHADAVQLLRECTRVARVAVIVGDLRRSWLALGGLWLSSFALGFHPISRHDGLVSIRRGFTVSELATLIMTATGRSATVKHAIGWRITATWTPNSGARRPLYS